MAHDKNSPRNLVVWLSKRGTPLRDITDFLVIDYPDITDAIVRAYIESGYTAEGVARIAKQTIRRSLIDLAIEQDNRRAPAEFRGLKVKG